jgi:hypothetical protein
MPDDSCEQTRHDLEAAQAESGTLRRELGDLRAQLCQALGILHEEPGPQGLTVLSVASDREILAEVRRLCAVRASTEPPVEDDGHRWKAVDSLILKGRKIQAVHGIRTEFGGDLHKALDLLSHRYEKLRRERPDDFVQGPETYWDGFHS